MRRRATFFPDQTTALVVSLIAFRQEDEPLSVAQFEARRIDDVCIRCPLSTQLRRASKADSNFMECKTSKTGPQIREAQIVSRSTEVKSKDGFELAAYGFPFAPHTI